MNGRLIDLAMSRRSYKYQYHEAKSFIGRIWLLAGACNQLAQSICPVAV